MASTPGPPLPPVLPGTSDSTQAGLDEFWKDALQTYKDQTGKDLGSSDLVQRLRGASTASAKIEECTKQFERFRAYGGKTKTALTSAVPLLLSFAVATGDALSIIPGSQFVVTAITVLLETVEKVSKLYDLIEDMLSKVESALSRFDTYRKHAKVKSSDPLMETFGKILVEILYLVGLYTKFSEATAQDQKTRRRKCWTVGTRRAKDYFSALLGESEFEDHMKTLQELTDEEKLRLAVATFIEAAKTHEEVTKMKDFQVSEEIIKWIKAPMSDLHTHHREKSKKREGQTCKWIDKDETLGWMQTGRSLCSIIGDAGSGKSVISSYVIDAVDKRQDLISAYFYFDSASGSQVLKTSDALMRSLIYRVACASPSCWEYIQKESQKQEHQLHGSKGLRDLDDAKLRSLLLGALPKAEKPIVLVIDALDECAEQNDMLDRLGEICQVQMGDLHLLVTTRPETSITSTLGTDWRQLRLGDNKAHHGDIEEYVNGTLARDLYFTGMLPATREMIANTLKGVKQSESMFLWVELQLKQLRYCTANEVEEALKDLPIGLDATYSRILSSGQFSCTPKALRRVRAILGFIAFSERPLTVSEIAAALTFDYTRNEGDRSAEPNDRADAVIHALPRLIKLVDGHRGQTVQFIHFSVKEFLIRGKFTKDVDEQLASYYHLDLDSANSAIAYLLVTALKTDPDHQAPALNALKDYAHNFWIVHAFSKQTGLLCLWKHINDAAALGTELVEVDGKRLAKLVKAPWAHANFNCMGEELLTGCNDIRLRLWAVIPDVCHPVPTAFEDGKLVVKIQGTYILRTERILEDGYNIVHLTTQASWTIGVSACMSAGALKFSIAGNFAPTFSNYSWVGDGWVRSTEPEDLIPLSLLKSVFPNQTDIEQALRELEQL